MTLITYIKLGGLFMKCPFCSHENTRVIDSRPADENNSIRRRRVCDECGKRFTTYEKVETIPLIVIKKDNNRETYDRTKIEAGVLRACHKRPISATQITQLVDSVETAIFNGLADSHTAELTLTDGSVQPFQFDPNSDIAKVMGSLVEGDGITIGYVEQENGSLMLVSAE